MKISATRFFVLAAILSPTLYLKAQIIDSSFGLNGAFISKTFTSTTSKTISISPQTNGKLLALSLHQYDTVFTINRINEFGKVDLSFGTKGKITAGSPGSVVQSDYGNVLTDGKGHIYAGVGIDPYKGAAQSLIMRFDRDGNVDHSFGSNGSVILQRSFYRAIDLQTNGKILVATYNILESGSVRVTRLNTNGQVDKSYGSNGIFTLQLSGFPEAHNLICLNNGKALVSFMSGLGTSVLRLKTNGTLDSTFGINGIASIPGGDLLNDMIIKNNNKIMLLGTDGFASTAVMKLYQFTENGKADSAFGTNGITSFPGLNLNDGFAVSNVDEVYNKKVVVAGTNYNETFTGSEYILTSKFEFVRFTADGKVDSSYGADGVKLINETDTNVITEVHCFNKIDNSSFVLGADFYHNESPYGTNYGMVKFIYEDTIAAAKLLAAVINKPLTSSQVMIYPNPVTNTINIRNERSLTFTLNNAEGKILQTKIINGNGNIDVSRYAPGVYYLTEKETGVTHKIVKQ